jgi:hypothetical protein
VSTSKRSGGSQANDAFRRVICKERKETTAIQHEKEQFRKLGHTPKHKRASLIKHERIETTLPKAKELRQSRRHRSMLCQERQPNLWQAACPTKSPW